MAEIARFTVAIGGQLGEICQLQFGDVDSESGLVHFRATGGRTNKSNRGRVVPLVPMAWAVYERQVDCYPSATAPRSAPLFTGSIDSLYTITDDDASMSTDKEYTVSGRLTYRLGRKLSSNFGVSLRSLDSDTVTAREFDETSVFAGIDYRLGN